MGAGRGPTEVRRWLARRTLQAALTLLIALVLLFLLIHVLPGDPLAREGERALTPQQTEALRARYGLDRPLIGQLAAFLGGLVQGRPRRVDPVRPAGDRAAAGTAARPRSCSAARCCCSTSCSASGWASPGGAARTAVRIAGSPPCRSLATPCRRSGWGSCWPGFVGVHWRLLPRGRHAGPAAGADAGSLTRAVDVLRHLVLPAITLSMRQHRRRPCGISAPPCWRCSAFLI